MCLLAELVSGACESSKCHTLKTCRGIVCDDSSFQVTHKWEYKELRPVSSTSA